jgi:hypothetical protein
MKYGVETGSGAMVYIPSFIKIGSAIQKLIGGNTQTHRQHDSRINLLLLFQNKEGRIQIILYLSGCKIKESLLDYLTKTEDEKSYNHVI